MGAVGRCPAPLRGLIPGWSLTIHYTFFTSSDFNPILPMPGTLQSML